MVKTLTQEGCSSEALEPLRSFLDHGSERFKSCLGPELPKYGVYLSPVIKKPFQESSDHLTILENLFSSVDICLIMNNTTPCLFPSCSFLLCICKSQGDSGKDSYRSQ